MQIIVGGAQEEMSLQNLMQDVQSEIANFDLTALADGTVSQTQVVQAVFDKLRHKGQSLKYTEAAIYTTIFEHKDFKPWRVAKAAV